MTEKQTERRAQIETAALEVLEKTGYKKASMLQIAKHAKASNETLYAWYGNKQALFGSLIASNAQSVAKILTRAGSGDDDPSAALFALGKALLEFTATEKAVIINRAAIADVQETGILAGAIEEHARASVLKAITDLMRRLDTSGHYQFDAPPEAAEVFVSLVLGDVQLQQALGAVPPLTAAQIEARARRASTCFDRLYRRP